MDFCGLRRSWVNLPPEILSSIGERLETPLDVSLFRSICKSWRSSSPAPPTSNPNPNPNAGILSPFLPLQIPNSGVLPFNNRPHDSLILVASAVLLLQPIDSDPNSKGWLITVEERKSGKLRFLKPLSKSPVDINLPSNFPNCISLFKFRVTEVAKKYSFRFASDGKEVSDVKVVLCSTSDFDVCTAMVLCGNGVLVGVRVKHGEWGYVRKSLFLPLVNLCDYGGVVYGVDDGGRIYTVDHILMIVTNNVVLGETGVSQGKMLYKGLKSLNHHLIVSNGELYIIIWDSNWRRHTSYEAFEVHKLNNATQKWGFVKNFDWGLLFLSPYWCFIVCRHYSTSGKVIIYSSDIHSYYANENISYSLFHEHTINLGRFQLLREETRYDDRFATSSFSDMIWPPPTWFLPDTFSSSRDKEHEEQSELCNCAPADQDSGMKFEELHIRHDLVPILQKVWAKHGDILEGCNVHSKGMICCALESLAKLIIILEGNTGRTLSEEECNDITTILCDLKHINVRVEWLSPFVAKAVALHLSKPMIAALAELDKAIACAAEMKMKIPNDLGNINVNVDQMVNDLDKDRNRLFERMPVSGPVDLDQCLAKRLF